MKIYDTPIAGLYNHKTPRYDGTFNVQQVGVFVIGESPKLYMIRLRLPVGNRHQGDELTVRKHNVIIPYQPQEPQQHDCTNAWWHN